MVDTHPWNTGFAWQDHDWPPTTLSADDVRHFDERGYLVLVSQFTTEELTPVVAELDRHEAKVAAHLDQLDDGRFLIAEAGAITFAPHLAARSATLAAFARHPRLLALCRDLVGPDVDLYHDQAVYKKPEKPRRFPWHQDNGYKFVEPQSYLTCWVALTDATEDNGCPRVAPGLHRLGTLAHAYVDPLGWECFTDPEEVEVAAVPAGSVVVFSSLTPHLTGPNITGA
ncbi:MAG: phytanoyl-CoA dioxygenase family protein, partial [Actinomycetota bacterium]|nr:phytanoyl-CoA dioxygenase family protein [Actinomycetota bacterium]